MAHEPYQAVASSKAVGASVGRFTPDLGLTSTARKGTSVEVPLTVQGAAAGKGLKKLTVQVSSDDGKTWKTLKVTTVKTGRYVTVKSPSKAGAVSLRVLLTDTRGGTLTQTVYRAYLVRWRAIGAREERAGSFPTGAEPARPPSVAIRGST